MSRAALKNGAVQRAKEAALLRSLNSSASAGALSASTAVARCGVMLCIVWPVAWPVAQGLRPVRDSTLLARVHSNRAPVPVQPRRVCELAAVVVAQRQ